jgi:flagellar biosynthesis/type III secretory pathway protein FliH
MGTSKKPKKTVRKTLDGAYEEGRRAGLKQGFEMGKKELARQLRELLEASELGHEHF